MPRALCTPEKCKSTHPPDVSTHPENLVQMSRTVFPLAARNLVQTDGHENAACQLNPPRINLRNTKKTQMLKHVTFTSRHFYDFGLDVRQLSVVGGEPKSEAIYVRTCWLVSIQLMKATLPRVLPAHTI